MTTSTFIRIVQFTMLAGALYDFAFALPIMLAPASLAASLGLAMPDQEIYLRFIGVFLLGLPVFYLMPVLHPGRYFGNVVAAAFLRLMGGLFLVAAVFLFGQARPLLLLAAADLAFAGVHYLSLVPFAGIPVWRLTGVDVSPRRPASGGF